MKRGGITVSVERDEYKKDYCSVRLANEGWRELSLEAKGYYHFFRTLAGAHGRDGAIRFAGPHDSPARRADVIKRGARETRCAKSDEARKKSAGLFKEICDARLFIIDSRQTVWIANAADEWARYSQTAAAIKKRHQRAGVSPAPLTGDGCFDSDTADSDAGLDHPAYSGHVPSMSRTPIDVNDKINPQRRDIDHQSINDNGGQRLDEAASKRTTPPALTSSLSGAGETPARGPRYCPGDQVDIYAKPPVECFCYLVSNYGEVAVRTARKRYSEIGNHDRYYQAMAELRDAIRDNVVKTTPHRLGNHILTKYASQAIEANAERRRVPIGFHPHGSREPSDPTGRFRGVDAYVAPPTGSRKEAQSPGTSDAARLTGSTAAY